MKKHLISFQEAATLGGVVKRIPPIWAKKGWVTTTTMVVMDKKTKAFFASRKQRNFPVFVSKKKKLVRKEDIRRVLDLKQDQVEKAFFDYSDYVVWIPYQGAHLPIEIARKIEKNKTKYQTYDSSKYKDKSSIKKK